MQNGRLHHVPISTEGALLIGCFDAIVFSPLPDSDLVYLDVGRPSINPGPQERTVMGVLLVAMSLLYHKCRHDSWLSSRDKRATIEVAEPA